MSATKKSHWLRTTLLVLIACGIAGVIIAGVQFLGNPDRTSASASLQFSFDGAAEGLAPNGEHFDLSAMASDEVLTAALNESGLAEKYTAEQIRDCLLVQGEYPENIVSQLTSYESVLDFNASRNLTISQYHPTLFRVTLYNDFDKKIAQKDLTALLENLIAAWKKDFSETYAMGTPSVNVQWNLENYDYPQQLTIVSRLMTQARDYALKMYETEPLLKVNGYTFNDIAVRLAALNESDISRLNANITMNALTRNILRQITQYQYTLKELNTELAKKKDQLEQLDALIASYKKNEVIYLTTSDSLTKIDGNSSQTYDELTTIRKTVADEIADINGEISLNQQRLDAMLANSGLGTAAGQTAEQPAETSAEGETAQNAENAEAGQTGLLQMIGTEAAAETAQDLAETAKALEEAQASKIKVLESGIADLLTRREAVMTDFAALLKAYNDQEINDLTVAASSVLYDTPKILSGAFIIKCVKTAGPICALGFMVCIILMIISRRKEEKR